MAPRKPGYGTGYDKARRAMLDEATVCLHCRKRPATRADHQPPLSQHDHRSGTGCCVLVPSCLTCEHEQAAELGGSNNAKRLRTVDLVEPAGFALDDPIWDRAPWLTELRATMPADAQWPRLMSAPHPSAVGSLGADLAHWAHQRRGVEWRWWQKLLATRLLEVDEHGQLLWETILSSTARQVGKSHVLADLCAWRTEAGEHFGAPQSVLTIAKDLAVARRLMAPARTWALEFPDYYRVRSVNGQESITYLRDGGEWLLRARDAAYSLTVSFAVIDEAWAIPAATVDDGIIPTLVAMEQSQLLLTSTAHRKATALMIGRRASALDQLGSPPTEGGLLLVEWSAPRDRDIHDPATWRLASPHWSARRQRIIAERLAAADAGESDDPDEPNPLASIECQWGNRWPLKRIATPRGEELVSMEAWRAAQRPPGAVAGRMWVAVEDDYGRGGAVAAVAMLGDDVFEVDGKLCLDRAEALDQARRLCERHPYPATLIMGASMTPEPGSERAGAVETRFGLPLLRTMLQAGRLVHDHTPALDEQLSIARVRPVNDGLTLVGDHPAHLVRALVWALRAAAVRKPIPAIH